jgi:hypothetical protein
MKLADLLDEHGLRLFKGDALIFGVLWGLFGSLLVAINIPLANIILAMNLAFILRGSIDYLNHRIATVIIIISFLFASTLDLKIFLISLVLFTLAGILEDRSRIIAKKDKTLGMIFDAMLYYPLLGAWYALTYKDWTVFYALALFTITYGITKYAAKKNGYK